MDANYQTLLKMWREEKEKKEKAEDKIKEVQTRLTEVEEDNKKLSHQIEDKLDQLRKSGL